MIKPTQSLYIDALYNVKLFLRHVEVRSARLAFSPTFPTDQKAIGQALLCESPSLNKEMRPIAVIAEHLRIIGSISNTSCSF